MAAPVREAMDAVAVDADGGGDEEKDCGWRGRSCIFCCRRFSWAVGGSHAHFYSLAALSLLWLVLEPSVGPGVGRHWRVL